MTRKILPLLAVSLLLACPRPKDGDGGDDIADEPTGETGRPSSTTAQETKPEPASEPGTETGAAETKTCEDQLAEVKAELAACQAGK